MCKRHNASSTGLRVLENVFQLKDDAFVCMQGRNAIFDHGEIALKLLFH